MSPPCTHTMFLYLQWWISCSLDSCALSQPLSSAYTELHFVHWWLVPLGFLPHLSVWKTGAPWTSLSLDHHLIFCMNLLWGEQVFVKHLVFWCSFTYEEDKSRSICRTSSTCWPGWHTVLLDEVNFVGFGNVQLVAFRDLLEVCALVECTAETGLPHGGVCFIPALLVLAFINSPGLKKRQTQWLTCSYPYTLLHPSLISRTSSRSICLQP